MFQLDNQPWNFFKNIRSVLKSVYRMTILLLTLHITNYVHNYHPFCKISKLKNYVICCRPAPSRKALTYLQFVLCTICTNKTWFKDRECCFCNHQSSNASYFLKMVLLIETWRSWKIPAWFKNKRSITWRHGSKSREPSLLIQEFMIIIMPANTNMNIDES